MEDLKLAQRALEYSQNTATILRERLDKAESELADNELVINDLRKALDITRAQRDTEIAKTDTEEYEGFLKQKEIDGELELPEFEHLRIQVKQMSAEELFMNARKRAVRQIDGLTKSIFTMDNLARLYISGEKVKQTRGQQPFEDISREELRELVDSEKETYEKS